MREIRERRGAVQRGECGGGVGDRVLGGEHRARQLVEQRKLPRQRFARGVQDAAFERGKLVRGEAHGVGQRLLVPEHRRMRLGLERGGGAGAHLDEIAEHLIVLDFERLDAGPRRVGRLQLGEHDLGIGGKLAQFVEVGVVAGGDEAAVAGEIGEAFAERRAKPIGERRVARRREARQRGCDPGKHPWPLDCFASLAMTVRRHRAVRDGRPPHLSSPQGEKDADA